MSSNREEKKEKIDQKEDKEVRREDKMSNSEQTTETEKQVQTEQPGVTYVQNRRRRFKLTHLQFHSHRDFRRQGGKTNFLNSWKYSRR